MKKQSGFTLIELMIVVAIIAILAAIALPAYQNYTRQARYSELVSAADGIKTAITVCYARTGDLTKCDTPAKVGLTGGLAATDNMAAAATPFAIDKNVVTITLNGTAATGSKSCIVTSVAPDSNGKIVWDFTTKCTYETAAAVVAG